MSICFLIKTSLCVSLTESFSSFFLLSLSLPPCDVFDEEDEGDSQTNESYRHGSDHQLLEAAEELLGPAVVEAHFGGAHLEKI